MKVVRLYDILWNTDNEPPEGIGLTQRNISPSLTTMDPC